MTLRSAGRDTVPMMGPRAPALAAPQETGKRALPAGWGWEVRRICSARFVSFILVRKVAGALRPILARTRGVRAGLSLVPRGNDVQLIISISRHQSNYSTFECTIRAVAQS